jgi:hypothetical protein
MNKNVEELVKKLEDFEKQFKEESKKIFAEGCQELFKDNPELESFGFKGYTMHFNDGCPVEYNVYADEPDINQIDGYDVYSIEDAAEKEKIEKLQSVVSEFINAFPTESIKSTFPDHSRITIYRDGKIEITEYDHD